MRQIRTLLARIAGIFTRQQAEADLAEELQSHLEMATAENIRRGMSPDGHAGRPCWNPVVSRSPPRRSAISAGCPGSKASPPTSSTASARCATAPRSPRSSC
jgi:hypothetical protein